VRDFHETPLRLASEAVARAPANRRRTESTIRSTPVPERQPRPASLQRRCWTVAFGPESRLHPTRPSTPRCPATGCDEPAEKTPPGPRTAARYRSGPRTLALSSQPSCAQRKYEHEHEPRPVPTFLSCRALPSSLPHCSAPPSFRRSHCPLLSPTSRLTRGVAASDSPRGGSGTARSSPGAAVGNRGARSCSPRGASCCYSLCRGARRT